MAYTGFPATYQPMYYPQYQQQTQQQNNSIIWVSGEAGAKAYLVAPNTTVQLWDSERQTIYVKTADASGKPTLKILDYTIREDMPTPTAAPNTYATKDDVTALSEQITGLRAEIDSLTIRKAAPKKKEADDE